MKITSQIKLSFDQPQNRRPNIQTIQTNDLQILPPHLPLYLCTSTIIYNYFLFVSCTSLKNMPKLGKVTENKEKNLHAFKTATFLPSLL